MIFKPASRGKSPKLITDDWRWQALVRKDERADGLFWYSVRTTGVYCRPSCPARPPNRENVAFHESPQNAEKAGFRSCKRCGPKGPGLAGQHVEAVTTACRMIKEADEFPQESSSTTANNQSSHESVSLRAHSQSAAVRWDRKLLRSHSNRRRKLLCDLLTRRHRQFSRTPILGTSVPVCQPGRAHRL
jgi:methylphosphotriester-DNA--protein-cysteine methyltransferase